jgi:hypothetical protein
MLRGHAGQDVAKKLLHIGDDVLVFGENCIQKFKEQRATFGTRAATGDFRDVVLRAMFAKFAGDQLDSPGWRIE